MRKAKRSLLYHFDQLAAAALIVCFRMIVNGLRRGSVVPKEVKNPYLPVIYRIVAGAGKTALIIGAHPGIGKNIF